MFQKLAAFAFALTLLAPGLLLAATPVNVNKADAATIASSLDGIGQSKAQAIVDWRDAHGPFKSANDLMQVKGIGQATITRNQDAILLSGGATSHSKAHASTKEKSTASTTPRHRSKKAAVATEE
ncbi:MAG: helix-hairpin-helix domain-containing protein [Rhodanobacter sp.]